MFKLSPSGEVEILYFWNQSSTQRAKRKSQEI